MGKLPYMPFYPADYIRDTRGLPDFCKGIWMDVICYLWDAPSRGVDTFPISAWASKCGTTEINMELALSTFEMQRICEVSRLTNGHVTLLSRRMVRDEKDRELNRKRQSRFRRKRDSNAVITDESRTCNKDISDFIYQKSEVRNQKEDKKEEKKVRATRRRLTDDEWWEALKANPAYQHVDWVIENGKMDAWFLEHPDRQKTRRFVLNWINKVPKPLPIGAVIPIRQKPLTPYQQMMERAKAAAEAAHG